MERRLRGIDVLSLLVAGLCLLEVAVGLALQPIYRKMFADFGGSLPAATEWMLRPVVLVVPGLIPMLLVAEGIFRKRSEGTLVATCVVAIVVALGLVVAFVVGMYLPIFGYATGIK